MCCRCGAAEGQGLWEVTELETFPPSMESEIIVKDLVRGVLLRLLICLPTHKMQPSPGAGGWCLVLEFSLSRNENEMSMVLVCLFYKSSMPWLVIAVDTDWGSHAAGIFQSRDHSQASPLGRAFLLFLKPRDG